MVKARPVSPPADELESQALGQVPGSHSGWVKGLHQFDGPQDDGLRGSGKTGQPGGGLVQPAGAVQALKDAFHRVPERGREGLELDLGPQVVVQALLRRVGAAAAGERLDQVPGVLPVIPTVLHIGGVEPLHLLQELVSAFVVPGRGDLFALQSGVFLKLLLDILPQLHRAHLKELHRLDHLGGQRLRLPLVLL